MIVFAILPCAWSWATAPEPQDRHVHVQSFRYGKSPSVLRCNRGDRVHLTFSAKDTAHSVFSHEFDIDAKVSPGAADVLLFRPSDPTGSPTAASHLDLIAKHDGLLGPLISKSQLRCHVWCGPLHAFEQSTLLIEPNFLLQGAVGAILGIVLLFVLARKSGESVRRQPDGHAFDLLRAAPRLKRLLLWNGLHDWLAVVSLGTLYAVLLIAVVGTQMAGRNLASMLVWVAWFGFLLGVLTPWFGRLWCLVCPIPIVGDWLKKFLRPSSPKSRDSSRTLPLWLATPWPRTLLLLLFGTLSTAVVASPSLSGWLLLAFSLVAAVMAIVFPHRAFCRALCPVRAYMEPLAQHAPVAMVARSDDVCSRCSKRSCQFGNDKGSACPYGLCLANHPSMGDCGLCMECLKTCTFNNAAVVWRPYGSTALPLTLPQAWQAMVLLVLGASFIVVHHGPWAVARDWVDIVDRKNWGLFALYAGVLWALALGGFPAIHSLVAAGSVWKTPAASHRKDFLLSSAAAYVPLATAVWVSFSLSLVLTNFTFVLQSISDPLGWGWDLIGYRASAWHPLIPTAIPWLQVATVLVGLLYALRVLHAVHNRFSVHDFTRTKAVQSLWLGAIALGFVWLFAGT